MAASPACVCCGAALDDDQHVLAGCSATGSADWLNNFYAAWQITASALQLQVPRPSADWLQHHRFPLSAALIPTATLQHTTLSPTDTARFLPRLHIELASQLAECLRRRCDLMATFTTSAPAALHPAATTASAAPSTGLRHACPLPADRQLSVTSLRQLEVSHRQSLSSPAPVAPAAPGPFPQPHLVEIPAAGGFENSSWLFFSLKLSLAPHCLAPLQSRSWSSLNAPPVRKPLTPQAFPWPAVSSLSPESWAMLLQIMPMPSTPRLCANPSGAP